MANTNVVLKDCECGCGTQIEAFDKWGRERRFVAGHNTRKKEKHIPSQLTDEERLSEKQRINKDRAVRNGMMKAYFIGLAGGGCTKCGYKFNGTNGVVFDFHHVDPCTKEFELNSASFGLSMERLMVEVEKCKLLCANCHRLEHSSLVNN